MNEPTICSIFYNLLLDLIIFNNEARVITRRLVLELPGLESFLI